MNALVHRLAVGAVLLLCLCSAAAAAGDSKSTKESLLGKTIIGIDLGTTYSCVGVYKDGRVEILPNDQGNRITPSYVAFTDTERLVGDAAKNQASLNPSNTVYDAKRLIGRRYTDKSVQGDKKLLPFDIVNVDNKPFVQVEVAGEQKRMPAEEISAMVLQKMKKTAELYLGQEVEHAVVTVPAYFNDAQRQATANAGKIAGLNVARIINEPTAAALAYGLGMGTGDSKVKNNEEMNILVYDLGGGTFDVSVLTLDGNVFEVLSTNGDTHLGGEDFDQRVMQHFLKLINKKYKVDLTKKQRALSKLRREVEKAKRTLSSTESTKVEIEALIDGADFSEPLSRAKFEELNNDLFQKTMKPVRLALKDAHLSKDDLDKVVLVGGSTRIPKIQELLKKEFGNKKVHDGINPDEAVAYGAAVQGHILAGGSFDGEKGPQVLDVTPLSLGIETVGGVMAKVIHRNTPIPTKKSEMFTTEEDNQTELDTKVFQGERAQTKYNVLLGQFLLTGIVPAPRGVPEIMVTFSIDSDGIIHVKAKDKASSSEGEITIRAEDNQLSEDDIKRMQSEAEQFAHEDEAFKKRREAHEELEGYAYQLKHQLNDENKLGGRINADDKDLVIEGVRAALEWLEEHDDSTVDEIEEQQRELESIVHPIIKKLYGSSGGPADGGDQGADEEEEEFDHDEL